KRTDEPDFHKETPREPPRHTRGRNSDRRNPRAADLGRANAGCRPLLVRVSGVQAALPAPLPAPVGTALLSPRLQLEASAPIDPWPQPAALSAPEARP